MDPEILGHYEKGVELERLANGSSQIEFARNKELLERHLPPVPARVLDVGGGPGAYAAWLAGLGYDVTLVDPVPMHVSEAAALAAHSGQPFTATVGDARDLEQADDSFDVALLFGPLYHLPERNDRLGALSEATRVVRSGGIVAVAAISRFASILDGMVNGYLADPIFNAIVDEDLRDGRHRNPTGNVEYFTTAYFHRPDELPAELSEVGLVVDALYGVEGPGWLRSEQWDEADGRDSILRVARVIESEPTMIGVSAHLLAFGHRPGD
jgi:ubiquinone/menaquinone biosynthesis C-methylase UbiE